jgi:hypothetical protein
MAWNQEMEDARNDAYWDHYEEDDTKNPMHESPPTGICSCCGLECTATCVDEGIGPYDGFGGGVHHDYRWVSPCCEEEVVEGGNKYLGEKIVVAKKRYHDKRHVIEIGEKYRRIVYRCWRKDGPSWMNVTHKKIIVSVPAPIGVTP